MSEELKDDIDRNYFFVSLLLPNALHDHFLQEIERGAIKEGTGYEDYLSKLIVDHFKTHAPSVNLPGLLAYEHEAYDQRDE